MSEHQSSSNPMEPPADSRHNSSGDTSRPGSESHNKKPYHRVKFSVGVEDDIESDPGDKLQQKQDGQPRGPEGIPQITIGTSQTDDSSEDVTSMTNITLKDPDWSGKKQTSAMLAQNRASKLASRLSRSAPGSRRNSVEAMRSPPPLPSTSKHNPHTLRPKSVLDSVQKRWPRIDDADNKVVYPLVSPNSSPPQLPVRIDDIPMQDLEAQISRPRRPYSIMYEDSTDEDSDATEEPLQKPSKHLPNDGHTREAHRLVRKMTVSLGLGRASDHHQEPASGTATPALDRHLDGVEYVAPPKTYNSGILASLMKLYDLNGAGSALQRQNLGAAESQQHLLKRPPVGRNDSSVSSLWHHKRSESDTPGSSGPSSGNRTPKKKKKKWYHESSPPSGYISPPTRSQSAGSLAQLLQSSAAVAAPGMPVPQPMLPHPRSSGLIATAVEKLTHPSQAFKHRQHHNNEDAITQYIASILTRQEYIVKLCRALMIFGAPTHRLEAYMHNSAKRVGIAGQFLYLPGCMVVSFDDPDTHTTEVRLVKENQGVDLGKFKDTFNVYKNVQHKVFTVEEAIEELDLIIAKPEKFNVFTRVLVYGVAAVSVGPFAFGARPIDFPITFMLGSLLGFLQLVVAPRSDQFQHVFEVAAAVVTSFLARAFGSIRYKGEYLFCFSAMAQSSIALILPGYIILCASLELQSRSIVAGSVRMVYAIIYALLLGFGITLGTALFGLMDSKATSDITCNIPHYWQNTYLSHWPFVPIFTMCLIIINQAKWKQAPAMLIIGFAGYQTNFWSSKRLANNVQVANALGAFVIGSLANLYSRFFHGLAAAAMLPAIFVQVPSGLAASGSLVAGLTSADQITGNATGITIVNNGTAGFQQAANGTYSSSAQQVYGGTIFNVGYGMVQVAIGISVGLFLSALVVYPAGKGRGKQGRSVSAYFGF